MNLLTPGVHHRTVGTAGARTGLMATTALQAAVAVMLSHPALAQLSPTARPTGGQVVAGQASISQSTATTAINQGSQRAAVNWQSFDVGSAHKVDIQAPNSSAVTLNRVVGPNPSQIAGKIQANGTVVIVNQAGLTVHKGAIINTAGLVVSSANISNENLMAGNLKFDQPGRPDAKIINQGEITVAERGLAALVAPQVANSGVIRANMGKVVLAGAEAHTLDLYGDGMVSFNVTKQVTKAPDGGAALVTNTGVVQAQGGTVVLTAQAVDGVVQTLVNAGGNISAKSTTARSGKIVIAGRGGDVVVSGDVSADGVGPGATGGAIVANASGKVSLTATANVSASGPAGGGTVAIGTTLARATGGPSVSGARTAKVVQVAKGAKVAADAVDSGPGGRVTVLSTDSTDMAGAITAKGGPNGGNGGFVEVSGDKGLSLTGPVDVTAPQGLAGTILLDPEVLNIVASGTTDAVLSGSTVAAGSPPSNATITIDTIGSLAGNIVLQAQSLIYDDAPITLSGGALSLTLQAPNITLTTNAPISANAFQTVSMLANGGNISVGADVTAGRITMNGGSIGLSAHLTALNAGTIVLSGTNGINLAASTLTAGRLMLEASNGGVTQQTGGVLDVGLLTNAGIISGDISLIGTSNAIGTIGLEPPGITWALAAGGNITVRNSTDLSIQGNVVAGYGAQSGGQTVTIETPGRTMTIGGEVVAGPGGSLSLTAGTIAIQQIGSIILPVIKADGEAVLTADSIVQTAGLINAGSVRMTGTNSISITDGRVIAVGGVEEDGFISLTGSNVSVSGVGIVATLNNATDIFVDGNLAVSGNAYVGSNGGLAVSGLLTQSSGYVITVGNAVVGGVSQSGGLFSIGGNLDVGEGFDGNSQRLALASVSGIGSNGVIAGWGGSGAISGSFEQTGGVIVVNQDANVFSAGNFTQGAGALFAAGGTLGVTASGNISVAGTVAAGGTTGFMLLTTGDGATATITGEGRVAGPAVEVNSGTIIVGNAVQAPLGVVRIDSSETQSVATFGSINASNTIVTGYTLFAPGQTLGLALSLPPVTPLQLPSTANAVNFFAPPIPAVLVGGTIDIQGRIVTSHLGLYAKTLISESALGLINTGTLTGTAGVLRNAIVSPGLSVLGWGSSIALGWYTPSADTIGNVSLTAPNRWNNIRTLSDFRTTGDFVISIAPLEAPYTLTQVGTVQAGTAVRSAATAGTLGIGVLGKLDVQGVISGGIDDGQSRPGVNVSLTTQNGINFTGDILMEWPSDANPPPVIAAVPNGTQGGNIAITVNGTGSTFTQAAGQINGGAVAITADTFGGTIALAGSANGDPPNGRIIATGTNGSVALSAGIINVGSGEVIAAVNSAQDVVLSGAVSQATDSRIQANRNVNVNGLLKENGGTIIAAGTIGATTLNQTAGTLSAGTTLAVGSGSGVAGWGGSVATGGGFNQSGGVAVGGQAVNVFSLGAFTQSGGAILASGGTLGVTATTGLSVGGTVSAAGKPSGFMLLTNGGNAVLTGVVAGPQVAVNGNVIGGNAVQAPAGTIQVPSGTTVFATAGSVTATTAIASGYTLVCANCFQVPSESAQPVPALALPSVQGPTPTSPSNTMPLVLTAGSIDIAGSLYASSLGLYARNQISQQAGSGVTASLLTGSAGAGTTLPAGLIALGWANAAAIGWGNTTGSASLPRLSNAVARLSDFATTGDLTLQSNALTQTGTVSAGGAAALRVSGGPLVQNAGTIQAGSVVLDGTLTNGVTLNGGAVIASAGSILVNSSLVTLGANQLVATTGQGTDISFAGGVTQAAGSRVSAQGNVTAASLTQNGGTVAANFGNVAIGSVTQNAGTITTARGNVTATSLLQNGGLIASTGRLAVGTGSGTAGAGGSTATTGQFVQNAGSITAGSGAAIFTTGVFTQAASAVLQSGGAVGVTANGGIAANGLIASTTPGSGVVQLATPAGISQAASGAIRTANLTGSAGGDVSLSGANGVANLGNFTAAGHAFSLANAEGLTVQGVITASSVAITAPQSTLTLAAGSGFAGLASIGGEPLQEQSFPVAGGPGVFLQAANIDNAGMTVSGATPIAVSFALTGPGLASIGTFENPGAKLFLDLSNGRAAGAIVVAGLQVRYGPPTDVLINLTGSVGGVGGIGAAPISFIAPGVQANYQINGCAIATSCGTGNLSTSINGAQNLQNLTTIPIINGLQDLQMGGMLNDFEDEDLLPDVAKRDYRT
ncbi:MAG: filamentous hemagglutinin N-terminal domain-containing protein [Proteobacteria bacterium]|nr:filamentous hemagglutinin N-terminal domain-containing protein [Pseudomonadota bacterium]